jgi:hypothetical protein
MFKSKKKKEVEAKAKAEKEAKEKAIEIEINLQNTCEKPLVKIDVVKQEINSNERAINFNIAIEDEYEMFLNERQFRSLVNEIYRVCPPSIKEVVYSVNRPTGEKHALGKALIEPEEEGTNLSDLIEFLNENGLPFGQIIRQAHEK